MHVHNHKLIWPEVDKLFLEYREVLTCYRRRATIHDLQRGNQQKRNNGLGEIIEKKHFRSAAHDVYL